MKSSKKIHMKPTPHYASLIGKYINRYGYSDINPVGRIIGAKGKTIVIVQRVEAGNNKTKMEFIPGGFSAICLNSHAQEYDFIETSETFKIRISKWYMKQVKIEDKPVKYYDFNF